MAIKKYATPVNFIIFQISWFACVLGAANKLGWFGPLLVLITVPLQIYLLTNKHISELIFVLLCGVGGFVLETLFIAGGVYVPLGEWQLPVCPPWMAALWFNFAMLVSISLRWLKGKYFLSAVLAGIAGPIAYWGGEKLGAIAVHDVFLKGYLPLAIAWAIVLPTLIIAHSRLTRDTNR